MIASANGVTVLKYDGLEHLSDWHVEGAYAIFIRDEIRICSVHIATQDLYHRLQLLLEKYNLRAEIASHAQSVLNYLVLSQCDD